MNRPTPIRPNVSPGTLVAYAPFALWSPHFETDLEIMRNHLDSGNKVVALSCRGELKTCEPNPHHYRLICAACQRRFQNGMRWLSDTSVVHETFYDLTDEEKELVENLGHRKWRDIEEIRQFKLDGADIGLAALSSVVSWTREPNPNIEELRATIGRHLSSAAMVYLSTKRKITAHGGVVLSVFNGRLASLRPALRAAQNLGIPSLVHERAGYQDRYSLTENTYPHDLAAIKHHMESCFSASDFTAEDRARAINWYEERISGINQGWYSFVTEQDKGHIPAELEPSRKNVVIFISSEDEYVAIEEWNNQFYMDQNEGISRLLGDILSDPRLRVFLRVHPNLAGVENSQMAGIRQLSASFPELIIIPPESRISSYSLLDAADVVITYGSTVGIEACYLGKHSLLMGRALYEDLEVCIRPRSHEELVEILLEAASGRMPAIPAGRQLGLLKYGHYLSASGLPFAHVAPKGLFDAKMRSGENLVSIGPGGLLGVFLRLFRIVSTLRRKLT